MELLLANSAQSLRPADVPASLAPGLYVHVPFCFHKCHYCDFYSITRQTPERMAHFVDLILREAGQWVDASVRVTPKTIFFGGGTPSLLPLGEMRRLLLGSAGEPHDSLLLFVGEEQVRWETPRELRDGDVVTVLAPMAGG